MFQIFSKVPTINVGILKPPIWEYVKSTTNININRVKTFYRQNKIYVPGMHILVKLINTSNVSTNLDLERYYNNIDKLFLNLSKSFKMTSNANVGEIHRGVFYGGNNAEFILATDTLFDVNKTYKNWQNESPVKVLIHDKSDFSYSLCNGKEYNKEKTISVIEINISKLLVMYKGYMDSQINNSNIYPANYFIGSYVIPNMLESHLQLCLFNRIYNTITNKSITNIGFKHPFTLPDYNGYINTIVDQVTEFISKDKMNYKNILHSIPSINSNTFYHDLILPEMYVNKQVDWLLTLSRLKIINLLIILQSKDILTNNGSEFNQILFSLNKNDVYNSLQKNLPIDVYFTVEEYLNNIFNLFK